MTRTLSLTVLLAQLVLAAHPAREAPTSETPHRPPTVTRDFPRNPPRALSLSVQFADVDPPRARVLLCLAPDPRLGRRLTLAGDAGPITLERGAVPCERGAVGYEGTTALDARALVERQQALDALARRAKRPLVFPVFEERARTATLPLPRLDAAAIVSGGVVVLPAAWVTPDEVQADRSLLINDPAVVRDPARTYDPCTQAGTALGKWTFGYLMQQIAGPTNAATMVRSWLAQWETAQVVNGLAVAPRALVKSAIIDPWQQASGTGNPLDLAKAPFRLLAIVNRIDLADNLVYGSGSGGELRFVFGALGAPPSCTPLRATVIFEFAVPRSGCQSLREWARAWVALGTLVPGSTAFASQLEALTEQIVRAGAAPLRPNGSHLGQLRTNEIAFADLQATPGVQEWEMREFRLNAAGALVQTTLPRTPRPDVNDTATLASWIVAHADAIAADDYDVPDQHPGTTPFRGASALTTPTLFWHGQTTGIAIASDVRHRFSLSTCSGCHARETLTPLAHVSPAAPGTQAAPLSGFLTGITVADPLTNAPRTFADLQRRQTVLAGIANRSCLFEVFRVPLRMAH